MDDNSVYIPGGPEVVVVPREGRWLPRRPPGPFHCIVCGTDFTRKHDLMRHILQSTTHRKLREAKVIRGCPHCWKTFLNEKAVLKHFENQHI